MQQDELDQIITRLDSDDFDTENRIEEQRASYQSLLKEIRFHSNARFWQYAPTYGGSPDFMHRLTRWLKNRALTSDDVRTMLSLVPHIQFIDRDDMLSLYRTAFNGPIKRWLMDQIFIDFSVGQDQLDASLNLARKTTWFCPVTDSMDIAQFHHVNRLPGKSHRPTWRTLKEFGSVEKIQSYMASEGFQRLVLLEDFVGSGVQSRGPLKFALDKLCPAIPILFVPLIISERGLKVLKRLCRDSDALLIEPIFVVPSHVHLTMHKQEFEPLLYGKLRELVRQTFENVRQPLHPEVAPLSHPLGFSKLGSMVVLFSNCPNNTIPLIWHDAPDWTALFPRVSRGA